MSRLFGVLITCAVAVTLSTGYAPAQETPDLGPYIQKKVNFAGVPKNWGIVDWHITGKKTSLVYLAEYDRTTNTSRLQGYKLSAQGVAGSPFTVMPIFNGYIYYAYAVWFDSAGGPVRSPAGAAGLLLVTYLPDFSAFKIIISAVGIDADGKPIGSLRKIMEKTPPEDERFTTAYARGCAGADTVSIVIGFINVRLSSTFAGIISSKAYYMQTDINGLQLGGVSEVPLPNAGNLNICALSSPYWTGSGWMMPAYNTKMQVYTDPNYGIPGTKSIGNELYIYTFNGGAGAPAVKFKRRLLYKDSQQNTTWTFKNATFLDLNEEAQPSAKKTKKTLTMFFGHRNYIPLDQTTLDSYAIDYYLVPINLRGKRAGNSIKVDIPQWQHGMPYDPDKFIYGYTNAVSNLVPGSDGRFYLAQNRSSLMAEYVSAPGYYVYDCEHELSLYELDPAAGTVELIARKASSTPVGDYSAPVLRWFNNSPAILNAIYVMEPVSQDQCYFTTISVR